MKNFDSRCEGVDLMLKTLKPYMVLSQFNLAENAALGYFASKHKIPSILISHGSHIYHQNQYAEKEHKIMAENILYGDYNYLFVQSPFAREMIIKSKKYTKDSIINVGPMLWGRQIIKVKSDKEYLNIVHAGTLKYRHTRFYIYETADEYVDSLIKLCNVVKNFPKVKLTIKIRPQDYELTLDSLINLLNPIPNNVVIEYNKTFYEVLKDADLLISFSSTTIEEALVNKVPVLLFGGNGRYSHMPCKKYVSDDGINKAVTYIDSYKELLNYFQKLNSIEKNFNISDDEFSNYIFNKEEVANIKDFFLKNKF